MRFRMKILTGILVLALVVLTALQSDPAAAGPLPEPDTEHVIVFHACYRGAAIIELWWKPRSDATHQVIDLSYFDNAFQPGTFREEAITHLRDSVVWPGLRNGTTH